MELWLRRPDTDLTPNLSRALHKQVMYHFQIAIAKPAEVVVWPLPPLQAIGCPDSILQQQPHEKFALGGCPHIAWKGGLKASFKLHLICRLR
jgi:hypothetical protein